MEKLFQDLERLAQVEILLSQQEDSIREFQENVEYEKGELNYAKVQLLSLNSPDFFLRLMPARLEKKRELAQAEVRAHTAALEEAKRALEQTQYSFSQLKAEYEVLLPRREEYAAGKGTFPPALEEHLVCVSGILLADRIIHSLTEARKHMTGEARRGETTNGSQLRGNRKLEYLSSAAQDAAKLRQLLEGLPNPLKVKGSYLSWPDHYVTEPTTPYAQMDRLNMAVETVRDVRSQLRELQ